MFTTTLHAYTSAPRKHAALAFLVIVVASAFLLVVVPAGNRFLHRPKHGQHEQRHTQTGRGQFVFGQADCRSYSGRKPDRAGSSKALDLESVAEL